MLGTLEEKPCHCWQPEPALAVWLVGEGSCPASSALGPHSLSRRRGGRWRQAARRRIVTLGCSSLDCDAVKVTGTQRATYPSPKGIPHQHLRSGVRGREMAKMCFWKLLCLVQVGLIMTTVEALFPSRLGNSSCYRDVWADSET